MFPIIINRTKLTRNPTKYKVNFAKTERCKKSSIPNLQRMLNEHELGRELQLKIYLVIHVTSELCFTYFISWYLLTT